jgi:hypothetical protein
MCISVDPRLISKAVYDYPERYDLKKYTSVQNFFRPLVKAAEILKDMDLDRKVIVVTGASSGLGECADLVWWARFQTHTPRRGGVWSMCVSIISACPPHLVWGPSLQVHLNFRPLSMIRGSEGTFPPS